MKPLAIDLFCGLGGWTDGLLTEGYDVIGFDNVQHVYGDLRYPAQLVLQDVLTLHGRQFKTAALIVASPPCQAYSWRAMPWKAAKAAPPPDNSLFEACFRIQREASEAAGHHIPMVVENVRGAQPWVGRSRWNFGSFHLWGDVPALMPMTLGREIMKVGITHHSDGSTNFHGHNNTGGSWFVPPAGRKCAAKNNPDGRKLGASWFHGYAPGTQGPRNHGSKSLKRKMASAMIAKIPLPLSRHIARTYLPLPQGVKL